MKAWQKLISNFKEISIQKYTSPLNGNLFVNIEYGKKVFHAENANYSYQKLHKVLQAAIGEVYQNIDINVNVLNLGLGGGSTVEILREECQHKGEIVSIEHDPIVVQIAKDHFDIDRFSNHTIIVADALHFLDQDKAAYGLIICDLFRDRAVPEKFRTEVFMRMLIGKLDTPGWLIFNFIQDGKTEPFFDEFINKFQDQMTYEYINPVRENNVLIVRKS